MATEKQKDRAHRLTYAAIDNGSLVRQPCEVCGAVKVDAHHDDYAKPLQVRWLCRKHHRQLHSPGVTETRVVRTDLTQDEYRAIRVLAIETGERVSAVTGRALRALLKGGKP